MKYKSELINEILETRGHETSSLHYESECINKWIEENKGAYPKLCDYESEWFNYIVENPIGEFPYESLLNVTEATVNNVVPYSYKSAILKGNTLVNLVKKTTINVESNQNDLWININKLYGGNLPKGKYILLYNIKKASSYTFRCTPRINLSDGTALFEGYENYNTTSGIKKWIFNATAEITDVYFWIDTNTEPILIEDFILLEYQEGMENWDIPYFEGMQSVKMPVLKATGKNLVVKPQYGYVRNGVIETNIKDWINSDYVYVKGLKEIIGSTSSNITGTTNIATYDENKQLLRTLNGQSNTTLNDDEYYVIFSRRKLDNTEFTSEELLNSQMQLEVGSVATTYEPYKSNILTVNEEVELCGIGEGSNRVEDELDCLTGEVTQRIGEYTIDGNENWGTYDIQTVDGYKSFVATIPELNNFYEGSNSFISGDFKMESWVGYTERTTEEMVWNHDHNRIGIKVKNETASNVEELKTFLASNPISFQYELATETIKTVNLTVVNQDGVALSRIKPIEGTMHLYTEGETIKPLFSGEIPVEAITQNLALFIGE